MSEYFPTRNLSWKEGDLVRPYKHFDYTNTLGERTLLLEDVAGIIIKRYRDRSDLWYDVLYMGKIMEFSHKTYWQDA